MKRSRPALPATWLVGKKVRLRPIEPGDVPRLHRWINESSALEWLNRRLPLSRREERDWAARVSTDPRTPTFVIQTRNGTDIGIAGLQLDGARAVFGIAIHDARYWSRGYGQDAVELMVDGGFRVLPLQRIELLVLPDNVRAIRCYENAGFKHEGVLRRHIYHHGKFADMAIMSVLHEEWQQRRSGKATP